ncbi:MAG: hypothetical protein AAF557_24750 [Pseudomonadota bacterium]
MSILDHNFNELAAGKTEAKKKREAPFSLRLSFAEKTALKKLAGDAPLGAYIKAVLSDAIHQGKQVSATLDSESLGRVLGALGKSRLSQNVNQLAKAVNTGTLPVTPETERDLKKACVDIAAMREELMHALGKGGVP